MRCSHGSVVFVSVSLKIVYNPCINALSQPRRTTKQILPTPCQSVKAPAPPSREGWGVLICSLRC